MLGTASKTSKKEAHLRDYFIVLDRYKWLIIAAMVITLSSTILYLRKQEPVYQARSSVIIEPKRPQEMVFQRAVQAISSDLETQIEVIKMRPVLASVVKQLDLIPSFSSHSATRELTEAPEGSLEFSKAVKRLRKNIKIGFVKNTQIVTITAEHSIPEKAQSIADAVAQAYIDQDRLSRLRSGRDAVSWLSVQLADLETKLVDSEEAFQRFKEREQMITLDDKRSEGLEEISRLNTSYLAVRTKRMEIKVIIDKLEEETRGFAASPRRPIAPSPDLPMAVDLSVPIALLNSPVLQRLGTELSQLQTELASKKRLFKGTYPGVIELKDRVQLTEQKILAELKRQRDFLKAQEDSLLAQQEPKRRNAIELSKKELKYLALEREATTNREMYNTLLTKVKELSLAGEADLNNIRIVEPAELPSSPAGNRKLTLILSGILGLSLGIGFAFFLEYMQNSIRTPDDVAQYLGLPILGVVPQVPEAKKSKTAVLIVQGDSKSAPAEAYRSLRTNFLFNPLKTIMVTSVGPGEGKSLTVVNLGAALALAGQNVLLVDADLRRPMLHRTFVVDKHKGLSAVLAGEFTIDEAIVETGVPNLSVLASGTSSANSSESLGSASMEDMISRVREQYDIVLFDSAPILGMADAAVLAAETDGIALVIKAGEPTRKALKMAVAQLEQVGARICGVVLNNVDVRRDRYYDYYYHYYYSPYEDDEEETLKSTIDSSRKPSSIRIANPS